VGLRFDAKVARAQYGEMIDAYRQAGVTVHQLPAEEGLPYQIFARDSSVMTPWGGDHHAIAETLSPGRDRLGPAVLSGKQHPDL
ncbi:hypothetical protein ACI4BF_27945, partial [Klebsiella pneumoniae]|uniref:hypothetical protein n=1 Tax=Klebsiella pneumoniae TaxID=573 RepID=UPI0038526DD2